MTYQSGRNILVAFAPELTYGVAAADDTGKVFRPNTGSINLTKDPIRSNENRRDGQMSRGRHGSRSVAGQYSGDLSLGSYDDLIEAVFRGTFEDALTIDDATSAMSSATLAVGANTITASGGSWITAGLRVGDVIKETEGLTTANKNRNLRITGLTATVITVAETLTVEAGPIAAYTVVRGKKLVMGTTPRSFTIEENDIDIDGSKLFTGCRVGQMQLALQPNGQTILTFNFVGQDGQILEDTDSPYFVDPPATTSLGMTAVEAVIRLGTGDVLDVDSLNLSINLNAAGHPVVGSVVTPDVFTNLAAVEGTVTALKSDMQRASDFLNETQMSLHLLFTENEAEPKDYCSFFVGNLTLASATDSDLGSDGARTQSVTLLIGKDERGGAYEASTVVYETSAA